MTSPGYSPVRFYPEKVSFRVNLRSILGPSVVPSTCIQDQAKLESQRELLDSGGRGKYVR